MSSEPLMNIEESIVSSFSKIMRKDTLKKKGRTSYPCPLYLEVETMKSRTQHQAHHDEMQTLGRVLLALVSGQCPEIELLGSSKNQKRQETSANRLAFWLQQPLCHICYNLQSKLQVETQSWLQGISFTNSPYNLNSTVQRKPPSIIGKKARVEN